MTSVINHYSHILNAESVCIMEKNTHIVIDNVKTTINHEIFDKVYEKIINLSTINTLSIDTSIKPSDLSKLLSNNNLTEFTINILGIFDFVDLGMDEYDFVESDKHDLVEYVALLGKMNRLTSLTINDRQFSGNFYSVDVFASLFNRLYKLSYSVSINKIYNSVISTIAASNLREIYINALISEDAVIKFLEMSQLEKIQIKYIIKMIDRDYIIKILQHVADSNLSYFDYHLCESGDQFDNEISLVMKSISENEIIDLFMNNYKITYFNISCDDYPFKRSIFFDNQLNIINDILRRNQNTRLQKRFACTKAIMD